MKSIKKTGISILLLIVISGISFAQQEIPESIKDKISNGIKYIENAKVPADMDKAIQVFTEASVIEPGYADVHYYLGKTFSLMQGNAGRVIKEYKKYLEMYPDAPDKEKINMEIAAMEDVIKTKAKSSLMGVTLVSLPDGIYIRQVSPNYPVKGRRPLVPVYVGDKILKINNIDIKGYTIRSVIKLVDEDTSKDTYREVEILRAGKTITVKMLKKGQSSNTTVNDLGEEDLSAIMSESKLPVAVFFTSDWCTQCDDYNRVDVYYAAKYKKSVYFVIANVDENTTLKKDFEVTQIPSICLYKNGKLFYKYNGDDSKILDKELEELIK
jgi:thioredoxin 1